MNATGKWAKRAVWLTLAAVLTIGCNPLTTIAFIFHKDDKIPAEAPLRPREGELHEKDQELTVLVLCSQGPGLPFEFAGADRELADLLGRKLAEEAKTNKDKITVVPVARVEKFKATNPGWGTMQPAVIGRKLGADTVIDVTLASISLYQPGSANQVYEGRADVHVSVYDVHAKDANTPRDHYEFTFDNPRFRMVDATGVKPPQFRKALLERLAYDLSLKHLDHKPSQGIGER